MRLFHVTPRCNSHSIAQHGLLADCAYDLFCKQIFFCPCRSIDYWINTIRIEKGIVGSFDVWELVHPDDLHIHFSDYRTRWIGNDVEPMRLGLCVPRDLQ